MSSTPEQPLLFPSLEWFRALQQLANADPELRRLGSTDTTLGMKVGAAIFLVTFQAFRCETIVPGSDDDLLGVDFALDMEVAQWQEMIENIKTHGSADRQHTLNTLDLRTAGGIANNATGDQYRADLFFRYNQTLQHFFNLSAQLQTTFCPTA